MKRREFIAGLAGAAAWPLAARSAALRPRIAILTLESLQDKARPISAFADALRGLGYVDGQSADIDYRYAAGDTKQLTPFAQQLIALHPDVAMGAEPSPTRALKNAAPTLPIVCPTLTEALIPELAASYARPGGSVTGIAQSVEGVTGKLLDLAIDLIPGMERVGFLSNPAGTSMSLFARNVANVAQAHKIRF